MLTSSAQIDSIIRVHFSKINPDSISAITDNFNNKFRKQKLSISLNKEIDRNLVLDFYATQWKLEYSVWADSTFESGTSDYFYINIFREHSEIFKLSYIDTSGRQIKLFDDKKISESMMSSYNTLFNVKLDTSATFRTKKSFEFLQFPSEILDKIVRKKDIKPVMALLQSQFPEDRLNGIRLVNKLRQQKFALLDERVNTTYNMASATKGLAFTCWADFCEWTKFQDELKNINNRQTE